MRKKEDEGEKGHLVTDQQLVVPCSLQLTMCKCGCARIVSVP